MPSGLVIGGGTGFRGISVQSESSQFCRRRGCDADQARYDGVRDIEGIDNNIQAGLKYVRFIIDQYFENESMDRLIKGVSAFASYDAGPARLARLRAKAA